MYQDKSDLLYTHVRWAEYEAEGVTTAQVLRLWQNIADGKPRSQWLDGTGLPNPDRTISLAALERHANQSQQQDQQRKSRQNRGIER